jgi:hypothetical protein
MEEERAALSHGRGGAEEGVGTARRMGSAPSQSEQRKGEGAREQFLVLAGTAGELVGGCGGGGSDTGTQGG